MDLCKSARSERAVWITSLTIQVSSVRQTREATAKVSASQDGSTCWFPPCDVSLTRVGCTVAWGVCNVSLPLSILKARSV